MVPFLPAVGVRFDIKKVNASAYGLECWKVLWRSLRPNDLKGAFLFEGDTAATLAGKEDVYCLGIQSIDANIVERVKRALSKSEGYQRVAATPMFVDGAACVKEPLVEAGQIDQLGAIGGKPGWAKPGYEAVAGAGAASPPTDARRASVPRPKPQLQSGAWIGGLLAIVILLGGLALLGWVLALPFVP
jgi:hypothetical protein